MRAIPSLAQASACPCASVCVPERRDVGLATPALTGRQQSGRHMLSHAHAASRPPLERKRGIVGGVKVVVPQLPRHLGLKLCQQRPSVSLAGSVHLRRDGLERAGQEGCGSRGSRGIDGHLGCVPCRRLAHGRVATAHDDETPLAVDRRAGHARVSAECRRAACGMARPLTTASGAVVPPHEDLARTPLYGRNVQNAHASWSRTRLVQAALGPSFRTEWRRVRAIGDPTARAAPAPGACGGPAGRPP